MSKDFAWDLFKNTGNVDAFMIMKDIENGQLIEENKKNQNDFVLWFTSSKFENQELQWDSPWGRGYPGWHIECTGISIKYLGEYLDIHTGGVDNIFPHHTNEIAQSEGYLGHPWCHYWVHTEHLMDETGKMSKSKGATLTVSSLKEKGYDPLAYRLMCLNSHYKKQLLFTEDILKQNNDILIKLRDRIASIIDDNNYSEEDFNKYNDLFKEELSDNLNTANAITVLYDVLKSDISSNTKLKLVESFDKVLSLDLIKKIEVSEELKNKVNELLELRNKYKLEKNYEKADEVRKEIESLGASIKDTREGTIVIWN